MWPGEVCAILASGPSMSREVADKVRAAGIRAIAVCRTWELAPWADMIYAADAEWWRNYRPQLHGYKGMRVTVERTGFPEMLQLGIGAKEGFSRDPAVISTGGNSGYQAICVAAHAGCRRVLLCGMDMHGKHWHSEYRSPMKTHQPEDQAEWVRRFASLKEPLEKWGMEVINCTPNSALRVWPYMPLEEALSAVEERAA